MTTDGSGPALDGPGDPSGEEAVELLQEFGLTEYRARAFVALTRLGEGTAKEVSEVADIPQARVYDCMEALAERGLVDVRNGKPRRFRAAGVAEAVDMLRRRYTDRIDRLESQLSRLEAPEVPDEGPRVWSIGDDGRVADRLARLIGTAESEVWLAIPGESLLAEDVLSALSEATDRGVSVVVGSPAEPVRELVAGAVPEASVVETWAWWESLPVGGGEVSAALLVDGRATLAAVAVPSGTGGRTHRAVWADDPDAALVSVLRPILAGAIAGAD